MWHLPLPQLPWRDPEQARAREMCPPPSPCQAVAGAAPCSNRRS